MDNRGVVPVVGTILMVALAVILATVIGVWALGLPEDVNDSGQAGVDFEKTGADEVTVTVVEMGTADEVRIQGPGGTQTLTEASETATVTGLSQGDTIQVIAVRDNSETVIQQYTFE